MSPRVSVLIPSWNREEYLGEAIESVLAQTYRDFEIVVVDDGSTDGTAELVGRYGGVRYIWQPHSGISAARNRALEEARSELIAWLDSDDLYAPTKLEKQVAYLDAHPECQIVFCLPVGFSGIEYSNMTPSQQRLMDAYGAEYKRCLPAACIRETLFAQQGHFLPGYRSGDTLHGSMTVRFRTRKMPCQRSAWQCMPMPSAMQKGGINRAEHRKGPH